MYRRVPTVYARALIRVPQAVRVRVRQAADQCVKAGSRQQADQDQTNAMSCHCQAIDVRRCRVLVH